jgi:hypothetical protein
VRRSILKRKVPVEVWRPSSGFLCDRIGSRRWAMVYRSWRNGGVVNSSGRCGLSDPGQVMPVERHTLARERRRCSERWKIQRRAIVADPAWRRVRGRRVAITNGMPARGPPEPFRRGWTSTAGFSRPSWPAWRDRHQRPLFPAGVCSTDWPVWSLIVLRQLRLIRRRGGSRRRPGVGVLFGFGSGQGLEWQPLGGCP